MNERSLLDLVHARAAGRLAPEDAPRLERALAADPALAALAEEYEVVYRLTGALGAGASEGTRTSFEELERRLPPPTGARRVAAAALFVLALGAAFAAGRWTRAGADELELAAIELDSPELGPAPPPEVPADWADYDPAGAAMVRFRTDLTEAETLAGAARRPLLVYGTYPGCPLAAALDAHVFSDPAVIDLAERTVPVRIDLALLSPAEQEAYTRRGYPFLEMWSADGHPLHSLRRMPDAPTFVESLHDGLAKCAGVDEQPPWDEVRGWARRLGAARGAELEGELARAERELGLLADDAEAPAAIRAQATAGLRRLGLGARQLLLDARALADDDVEAAAALLRQAGTRYAGTRYAADLAAALERLLRDGRFPPLVESDRSV